MTESRIQFQIRTTNDCRVSIQRRCSILLQYNEMINNAMNLITNNIDVIIY